MAEEKRVEGGGDDGVLLYYKYAPVPDVPALVRLYDSNCSSLGLLGRVRIAPDGVNVTVGGKMSFLEKHIAEMKSNSLFEGTDFKLARCDDPSDDRIARECGFTSLSVRVVKELVTFRSHPLLKSPDILNAGRHLSATEFHSVLHDAGNAMNCKGSMQQRKLVLLDARNVYETRIGLFQTPNVQTLNPEIRQYSDLPAWIDKHSEQLHGSCVFMYCTGGIRCEMASAYIRSKGVGYENVYQLFGGIQRYLEQFPDGGFFKGKNFVFDHRISVGSEDADILGSCLLCGSFFDDYSSRCRCTNCRMLVLVCDGCQGKPGAVYVCELCQKHHKGGDPVPLMGDDLLHLEFSYDLSVDVEQLELGSAMPFDHATCFCEHPRRDVIGYPRRKLRILCLHGFRQTASNFKGRTASLAKKLKGIVEFIFIDAPHELPFIYQPRSCEQSCDSLPKHATDVICSQHHPPPVESCKKKFAWLVSSSSNSSEGSDWKKADQPFDPLQYQEQTDGFEESYTYLKKVFSQMGPFDGVLGFSQGAAMVALLCEKQWKAGTIPDFRFAILCSGFSLIRGELGQGQLKCPSLHVYGNSVGKDRQIECQASMKLAGLFDKDCSMVIEHSSGHIIPTQPPYIDQLRSFLMRFL